MKNSSLIFLWSVLSEIIREFSSHLDVFVDRTGDLRVRTQEGRPFASVIIQRRHVGVYLLPIYYHPEVVGPLLSNRKSGKGTLRFKDVDDSSINELSELIETCLTLIGKY